MARKSNVYYIEMMDSEINDADPLLDIRYLSGQHRYRFLREVSEDIRKLFEDCKDRAYKIVYPGLRDGKVVENVYYRIYAPNMEPKTDLYRANYLKG